MKMNIWFDNSSFEDPFADEELQIDGLCQNAAFIRELVLTEAKALSSLQRVFLGGISQGYAMGMHVLLSLDTLGSNLSGGLGGFIGISGWLPFQNSFEAIISPTKDEGRRGESDEDDLFGSVEDGGPGADDNMDQSEETVGVKIARFVREDIMGIPNCLEEAMCLHQTSILLGHGDVDDNVKLEFGERSMLTMKTLCNKVDWKVYEEQGHWYKVPEQIDDIIEFLKQHRC